MCCAVNVSIRFKPTKVTLRVRSEKPFIVFVINEAQTWKLHHYSLLSLTCIFATDVDEMKLSEIRISFTDHLERSGHLQWSKYQNSGPFQTELMSRWRKQPSFFFTFYSHISGSNIYNQTPSESISAEKTLGVHSEQRLNGIMNLAVHQGYCRENWCQEQLKHILLRLSKTSLLVAKINCKYKYCIEIKAAVVFTKLSEN